MQLRTVLDVNVVDVQKRRNPSKHYVSCLFAPFLRVRFWKSSTKCPQTFINDNYHFCSWTLFNIAPPMMKLSVLRDVLRPVWVYDAIVNVIGADCFCLCLAVISWQDETESKQASLIASSANKERGCNLNPSCRHGDQNIHLYHIPYKYNRPAVTSSSP